MQEYWWQHINMESPPFSRDVGFPYRMNVADKDEYLKLLDNNEGKKNCYTSVYNDYYLKHDMYDKIYIDFDRTEKFNSLKDLRLEMLRFVTHMEDKYDCLPRIYFSGNGFSVYLDIEPIKLQSSDAMRHFILSEFGSEAIDTHPLGDRRRISRVPFTRNVKEKTPGNRYCIPIEKNWSVHDILHFSKYPERIDDGIRTFKNSEISKELKKYDYEPEYKEVEYEIDVETNQKDLQKIKEIVQNKPTKEECFDGRHRLLHYMIVPRMLEIGHSKEEIHSYCSMIIEETGANYLDYKDYVEYSIRRTQEGDRNGNMWRSWKWSTFLLRNPDLWEYYKQDRKKLR